MKNLKKLSRNELKNVFGGDGVDVGITADTGCWIWIQTEAGGPFSPYIRNYSGSCSQQSIAANSVCLGQISGGANSCHYDCACDGLGH